MSTLDLYFEGNFFFFLNYCYCSYIYLKFNFPNLCFNFLGTYFDLFLNYLYIFFKYLFSDPQYMHVGYFLFLDLEQLYKLSFQMGNFFWSGKD